jgi:hypothetical protein
MPVQGAPDLFAGAVNLIKPPLLVLEALFHLPQALLEQQSLVFQLVHDAVQIGFA